MFIATCAVTDCQYIVYYRKVYELIHIDILLLFFAPSNIIIEPLESGIFIWCSLLKKRRTGIKMYVIIESYIHI